MADRPADDVTGVKDEPNKGDSETPEQTMERHEELHREHRGRLDEHDDHIDEHHDRLNSIEDRLGLRPEERKREARDGGRAERRAEMANRRRHD